MNWARIFCGTVPLVLTVYVLTHINRVKIEVMDRDYYNAIPLITYSNELLFIIWMQNEMCSRNVVLVGEPFTDLLQCGKLLFDSRH
jgi:hypothetical protein